MTTPSKVLKKAKVVHKLTPDRAQKTTKVIGVYATPPRAERLAATVVTPDTADLGAAMRIKDHGFRGATYSSRYGRTCRVKYTDFQGTAVSTKNCDKQMIGIHGGGYRGAQCRYAPSSAY